MLKFQKSCAPAFSGPFSETRRFKWNVEATVTTTMDFEYYIGEGPLYWFRIEWHQRNCPQQPCADMTPYISNTAVNCPYEIIDNCIILPPECPCPPCVPCEKVEIWHMLATSVNHLCERINQECCNAKPQSSYYITRVQQYLKPALCCDVDRIGGSDEYADVSFINCECGNLVDPCLAKVIYPCYVNRCGINGPAFDGGPQPPISIIKLAPDLLSHLPEAIESEVIAPIPPLVTKTAAAMKINKFGPTIHESIVCQTNLGEVGNFGDYLKRNRLTCDALNLYYKNSLNVWHGSKTLKDWKLSVEWSPLEKRGYKLNISLDNNNKSTKFNFIVKSENLVNNKGQLDINIDYVPTTDKIAVKNGTLQSKVIKDDLGLLSKWKYGLFFNLKG